MQQGQVIRLREQQRALPGRAALARRGESDGIPDVVRRAYAGESFHFGPEYIIPKPFDPRVLLHVAPAVAEAAMQTGVARRTIDIKSYRGFLEARLEEISSL